jgi:hypothetical protein
MFIFVLRSNIKAIYKYDIFEDLEEWKAAILRPCQDEADKKRSGEGKSCSGGREVHWDGKDLYKFIEDAGSKIRLEELAQ